MSMDPSNLYRFDWPNDDPPPSDTTPASKRRCGIQSVLMFAIGLTLYFGFAHKVMGMLIGTIGLLLMVGLQFSQSVANGSDAFARFLTKTAGTALTWMLLTPLFYLIFGIGRLVLLLNRKDPMRRRLDPSIDSYWQPVSSTNNNTQKQY